MMDWLRDVDQRALRQIWGASTTTLERSPAPVQTPTPEPESTPEAKSEPYDGIIETVRGKGKLKNEGCRCH